MLEATLKVWSNPMHCLTLRFFIFSWKFTTKHLVIISLLGNGCNNKFNGADVVNDGQIRLG